MPSPQQEPSAAGPDAVRKLVELRIHGVSGTPPEGMLDARFVALQAGDATTGFYAPDPDEPLPGAAAGDRPRWLEGYSWRGLTSGSPLQALWVFLAPFALANTAAAMRPPVDRASARGRFVAGVHAAMVRVFALSLGLTLVMAAYIAAIDQLAWQCGNNPTCITDHSLTKFLGWSWLASPPRRIAVALVLPLAVIVTLWFLARRGWKARAAVLAIVGKRYADPESVVDHATALDHPSLWDDREPSEYLRHIHVGAALSLVSAMAAVGVAYSAESSARWRVLAAVAFALLALAVVAALVGWGERRKRLRRLLSVGVLVGSVAVCIALVVMLLRNPEVNPAEGVAISGVETAIVALFLTQMILMLGVGIAAIAPRAANRSHRAGLAGAGSALVCGLALVLGALFSAGVVLRVGDYLGQSTTVLGVANTPDAVPIVVPNALTWAAFGAAFTLAFVVGLALLGALVFLVVFAVRSVPKVTAFLRGFVARVPAPDIADAERKARVRQVARAVRFARLTDRVGPILVVPALFLAVVALATTVVVLLIDTNHYHPAFETERSAWIAQHAATYGSWVITGFALLTLLIVLRARSNARLRRTVGILWDLTTFWPRHAQPLGPPCYTDRALPEFVFRTSWHVTRDHDVIVSAHSQGSIIAATVLLQLPEPVRRRVAFLTYGSPLHRLYAPWFPAYFNVATFAELDQRLADRWVNLYRNTDPIGGNIPPGPPTNVEIIPGDAIPDGDFVYPKIRVHSDYPDELAYRKAVSALDGQLRVSQVRDRRP